MAATGLDAPSPMRGCSEGQGPEKTPKGRKERRSRQQKGRNNSSSGRPSKENSLFNSKQDPLFEEYWSKEEAQRGLKSENLIQGVLRINQRKYEDAYVDDPDGGGDYYISGLHRRNRALERDVVVLQVLPPEQWLDEKRFQPTAEARVLPTLQEMAPSLNLGLSTSGAMCDKSSDDAPTDGCPPLPESLVHRLYAIPDGVVVGEEVGEREVEAHRRYQSELMKYRRTAKVVYIVHKEHSRTFAGHLKAFDKKKGLALLSPKDSKIPRVLIPLETCPSDYVQNPKKYGNTLFIGRILSWERDSPFARGVLVRSMGEAGEIEPETESFLIENEVEFGEFSPEALQCLPKTPWTIPPEEESRRRDFRSECVFTVDPESARDLDDALHVKEVDEGVYEVGVHIADVSYFVKAGTPLDEAASRRATSVYLVQRVIPMLPRLLCEQLCSLNPNEDRLTLSVVWRLTPEGKLIDEWMGRSIIRSCAKLSYSHAQAIIDEPSRQWQEDELPSITNGFTASQVAWGVNTLNKLATGLRRERESKGTLRLNQPKLKFTLNQGTGLPSGCDVYIQRESNRLIEEFMLLANMAVAQRIWRAFPDRALLRRHPSPKDKSAWFLAQQCNTLGVTLDVTSAAYIQDSLNQYQGSSDDKDTNSMQKMVVISLCSKIMELARYFCTGTVEKEAEFRHYALNVPRYTHFTSPIRRYADILVHRQLTSSLGEGSEFTMISEEVESQAHHCNKKKKSSKTVEEMSVDMFFAIFIKECGGIRAKGIVVQVLDKAFDVLLQEYGVIKRVYCEQLELESFEVRQKEKSKLLSLTLEWPGEGMTIKQELDAMCVVEVELTSGRRPLQYDAKLLPPVLNK